MNVPLNWKSVAEILNALTQVEVFRADVTKVILEMA